ncbi:MAG: response regulator [Syntrophomonadaceae bacterium]|nr:response regulator [Syntrophomonadaceae bacterium]
MGEISLSPSKFLILIVDDSGVVRAMLRSTLEKEGYRVLEASNGQKATEICQKVQPDMVLLDILMPVMDGLTTCRHLRRMPGGLHLPILMVTGLTDDEAIGQVFEAGATDIILKPVNMVALRYRVQRLLKARLAAKALRESELKHRLLLASIRTPILALDRDLAILYCNEAYAVLMGKSGKNLEGDKLAELFPGIAQTASYAAYLQVMEQGGIQFVQNKLNNRNLHERVYPTPWGILSITEDITERMRAETISHQLHQRLQKRVEQRTTELVEANVFLECEIAERKEIEKKLRCSYYQLHKTLLGTVDALAITSEKRDSYTAGHQRRVAQLACAIAQEMGLGEQQLEGIRVAASLHDIGKIYVPMDILSKSTRLSDLEMNLIKTHPQIGYEIVKPIPFKSPVAETVLQHHERLDGSGYPNGLRGSEILLEAKIIAVADVVEAITSHRPYRSALGLEVALQEIETHRGNLYEADIVDACCQVFKSSKFSFQSQLN